MSNKYNKIFERIINILYPYGFNSITARAGNVTPDEDRFRNMLIYKLGVYKTQQAGGKGADYKKFRATVIQIVNNLKAATIVTELPQGVTANNILTLAFNDPYENKDFLTAANQLTGLNDNFVYVRLRSNYFAIPSYLFENANIDGTATLVRRNDTVLTVGVTLYLTNLLGFTGIGTNVNTDIIYTFNQTPTIETFESAINEYNRQTKRALGGSSTKGSNTIKLSGSTNPPPTKKDDNTPKEPVTTTEEKLLVANADELLNQVLREGLDEFIVNTIIQTLLEDNSALRMQLVQPQLVFTRPQLVRSFVNVEDIVIVEDPPEPDPEPEQDDLSNALRDYIRADNPNDINRTYRRLSNIITNRYENFNLTDVEYEFLRNAVQTIMSVARGWNNYVDSSNFIAMLRDPRPQLFAIMGLMNSLISLLETVKVVLTSKPAMLITSAFIYKIMYYSGLLNSDIEQPVKVSVLDILIDTSEVFEISEDTVIVQNVERTTITPTPITTINIRDILTNSPKVQDQKSYITESYKPPPLDRPFEPTTEFDTYLWNTVDTIFNNEVNIIDTHTPVYMPVPGFEKSVEALLDLVFDDRITEEKLNAFTEIYKNELYMNKDVIVNFVNQGDWSSYDPPGDDEDDDAGGEFGLSTNITKNKLSDTPEGYSFITKTIAYWLLAPSYKNIPAYLLQKAVNLSLYTATTITSSLGVKGVVTAGAIAAYTGSVVVDEGVQGIYDRATSAKDFVEKTTTTLKTIVENTSVVASNLTGVISNVSDSVLKFSSSGIGSLLILGFVGALLYGVATSGISFSIF